MRNLLRSTLAYDVYIIARASALRALGWFRSVRERAPVDGEGAPLPWYTYPAIHFISSRIDPGLNVFEFGCGNSTLWWAKRVRAVDSVEHDFQWYRRMQGITPSNVTLTHHPAESDGYARQVQARGRTYDVIVIDGIDRNTCAQNSLHCLSAQGVIIWDNTERENDYREGLEVLKAGGFRRLDFEGLAPSSDLLLCTTILYRPDNCFGI